jgi:hypothetical protein
MSRILVLFQRPATTTRSLPSFLNPQMRAIGSIEPVMWLLGQLNSLTTVVLFLISMCYIIAGSSAHAEALRDPALSVFSLRESQESATSPKSKAECTQDQYRRPTRDLERALTKRLEILYPNMCPGPDGQTFAIRKKETEFQGDVAATVSYVLVLFETCEEGSPYEALPRQERWAYSGKEWKFVGDDSPILNYDRHKK